jgi:hypothetical protein
MAGTDGSYAGISALYDVGSQDGMDFLVMEVGKRNGNYSCRLFEMRKSK